MKQFRTQELPPFLNSSRMRRRALLLKPVRYLSEHRRPRRLIGISLMHLIYAVKRIWQRDELVVSPQAPREAYSLWKLCRLAGIKTISEKDAQWTSSKHRLGGIRHDDSTWDDETPGYLNGLCTDISKSHVDAMFEQAFGYSTKIDPTTFHGQAVIKSEINYSGGGVFVTCPIAAEAVEPGHIYQRLVDNETSAGVVTEYRVSVICGEITDVIDQRRAITYRLGGRGRGGGRGSTIRQAEDVFSKLEIAGLVEFCALMNLDFGELDVLPDVNEERPYVLDANKTPSYMVRASSFRLDRFLLIYRRARAFRTLLRLRARKAAGTIGVLAAPGGAAA